MTRTFHHPVIGTLTLDVHQLSVGAHSDLLVVAYTAPAGSLVTLKVTATDAAGGQISETITSAYRTGPATPDGTGGLPERAARPF